MLGEGKATLAIPSHHSHAMPVVSYLISSLHADPLFLARVAPSRHVSRDRSPSRRVSLSLSTAVELVNDGDPYGDASDTKASAVRAQVRPRAAVFVACCA